MTFIALHSKQQIIKNKQPQRNNKPLSAVRREAQEDREHVQASPVLLLRVVSSELHSPLLHYRGSRV